MDEDGQICSDLHRESSAYIRSVDDGHNALMDAIQAKIIELLREVHVLALKEIERLNFRITELEIQNRQASEQPIPKPAAKMELPITPTPMEPPVPTTPGLLNEHQVAEYLNMSLGSLRRWRLFRTGPKYLKIGSAVRYRREDLDTWLNSRCRASS